MDIKKNLSGFQMIGMSVKKLNFSNQFKRLINDKNTNRTIDIHYGINNISQKEISDDMTMLVGLLTLTEHISLKRNDLKEAANDETLNLSIDMEIEGCFTSNADDRSEFENKLKINGAAALYTNSRAIVQSITSICVAGDSLMLPMVDFVRFYDSLKEDDRSH